ncbi:hypothetical protein NDU88_003032 [Pleurodeles waltl]|uniref:RNA helicase n=1 Tax=Pleurodeles waltl TaxID=8319 RepID=A0AAV7KWD4_PLEWA|nr:hypothetical protein NDU88_003032 [Pleurodeles waltl]
MPADEELDLRHILVAMQHSLTQIDGKIDSLFYRMDRMSERLDKHAKRLDQADITRRGWPNGNEHWVYLTEQKRRLGALERELAQLEEEQELNADDKAPGCICAKLTEFQDTAWAEVQHMGKYATARMYGEGERPGSTLAKMICPNRGDNLITVIQVEDGSEIREPELIPNRFCEYYQSLYTTKIVQDPEGLLDDLMHIEMPRLAEADRDSLSAPLTLEEMNKVIGGMAEGKAPCPDGLTAYKHLIFPYLKEVFEDMVENGNCICKFESLVPLFIVDATCYFARIVFKDDPYASLAKEMSDFYAVSNNRKPVVKVEKSAMYGVQDGLHYHRIEVLETTQKDDNYLSCMVNFIDEGRRGKVQNHNLLQLPARFHSLPPQAVEIIVCRVKPIDNEIQWNPKVTRHINAKIKGKMHDAKVVFCLGNTVFVDPLVHVVKLVDLKTSLNEYNVRSEILSTGMGVDNPEHLKKLKKLCSEEQETASSKRTGPVVDHSSTSSECHNSSSLKECVAVSEICNETQMVQKEKYDELHIIHEPKTDSGTSTLTPFSEPKSLHPEVKWFQKEDSLTLAIKIRNVAYHNCTFSSNRVVFSALAGDKYYVADLELNGEILTDKSFCMIKNEEPVIILCKTDTGAWNSLLKRKKPNVSFDFDHWEYHEDSDRFPVATSCAKTVYTAYHEEGDSSEKSESESD